MLGETYEYVTKDIKYISEAVSNHPPIFALHVETASYEINRICETTQSFNGGNLIITDKNDTEIIYAATGDREAEKYTVDTPQIMISNLIGVGVFGKGGRHVEPQGDQKIINHTTGDVCYI